jgi:hypothetical protein
MISVGAHAAGSRYVFESGAHAMHASGRCLQLQCTAMQCITAAPQKFLMCPCNSRLATEESNTLLQLQPALGWPDASCIAVRTSPIMI